VPCSIHRVMDRADAAWRAELRRVSIADLVRMLGETAPPRALAKGIAWFQEVLT
jgi:DNA-binding IscR family transcriptional regulator